MNELQEEIIQFYFEGAADNDYLGIWFSLKRLSEIFEETPVKQLHHAIMELVERQILIEKSENKYYPHPKVYRRFLGLIEHEHLSIRDQLLLHDMRSYDPDGAWGLEWWFLNDIWPTLQTDNPPDQNIPILKEHMSAALKYYRDENIDQDQTHHFRNRHPGESQS